MSGYRIRSDQTDRMFSLLMTVFDSFLGDVIIQTSGHEEGGMDVYRLCSRVRSGADMQYPINGSDNSNVKELVESVER